MHFGELFLQKVHLLNPNDDAGLKGAGVLSVLFSLYILYIGPFYYKKQKKKSAQSTLKHLKARAQVD